MITFLILLIVLGFIGHRVTTAEERARLVRMAWARFERLKTTVARSRLEGKPFHDALRERTRWAVATPVLIALNAVVFLLMLFGPGAFSEPDTLVSWGANVGPRTTNGEWWRLVAAMFVHSGFFHLLVNIVCLAQFGLVLERLVGPLAFSATYVAAGVFASLVSIAFYPVAVSAGASGAICGLYGVAMVWSIWNSVHESSITIPLEAMKRLAPAATVFALFNMVSSDIALAAEIAGLAIGFACGLVLVVDVETQKAPIRRVTTGIAVAFVIVVASAVTLRGITDVKSEIDRVAMVEESTTRAYEAAASRFKDDRIGSEQLAAVIDDAILPELQSAQARLQSLEKVPSEHQPLLATAEEYLRLRVASWRLRADGLRRIDRVAARKQGIDPESDTSLRLRAETQHRANLLTLARAETTERMSLQTLKKLKPAEQSVP